MDRQALAVGGALFSFLGLLIVFIIGVLISRWIFRINEIMATLGQILARLDRLVDAIPMAAPPPIVPPPDDVPITDPLPTPTPEDTSPPPGKPCPKCGTLVYATRPVCPKDGTRVPFSRLASSFPRHLTE